MSDVWPEDGLSAASMGDLFDKALHPKERVTVLMIPARIEDQGPEAVAAWVKENHPGHPVAVLPEKRSIEEWLRKVREWEGLSAKERKRRHEIWLRWNR